MPACCRVVNLSHACTRALLTSLFLLQIAHFRSELRDLKQRNASLTSASRDVMRGRDDVTQLRRQTDDMGSFCDDVKKATQSLNEDIHELNHQCLEAFASLEESKRRFDCLKSDQYQLLLAARKLDPVTERRMREIQTRYQYVDAGIRDVNFKLDAEWQTYESRHKGKRA